MKEILIHNEEEALDFGRSLAQDLKPGDIVALSGDLGAGKTTLTKAIAKGLGIESHVTSPTFLLVQEYKEGRMPLYHFDVYRLHGEDDLYEIGFEDYLFGDGVCVIEWADQVDSLIPASALRIHISYGEKEGERIYQIQEGGRGDL